MRGVRVFWLRISTSDGDNESIHYSDFECDNWEVIGNLLVAYKHGEYCRHIPLIQLQSFQELP